MTRVSGSVRAMWALGDYHRFATATVWELGLVLVERHATRTSTSNGWKAMPRSFTSGQRDAGVVSGLPLRTPGSQPSLDTLTLSATSNSGFGATCVRGSNDTGYLAGTDRAERTRRGSSLRPTSCFALNRRAQRRLVNDTSATRITRIPANDAHRYSRSICLTTFAYDGQAPRAAQGTTGAASLSERCFKTGRTAARSDRL
jgi:hypothetical protein